MKNLLYIAFLTLTLIGCKQKETQKQPEPTLSTAEKIANAHGFEHWNHINEIDFTFAGARHWKWSPKTNAVTYTKDTITVAYNRAMVDSTTIPIDRAFVNDKFWLLIPFQLVWDKSASISEAKKTTAPISKKEINQITITYPSDGGGYTPGDAYDIYFDDEFIIREWAFRKGNKPEPSLVNTFENYQDFNGIKIALEHTKAEGDWNLKFSDVEVILEP
ncbi:hypothetical protein V8G61_06380 [Gaetbulibacter sp. M240]|uniref:hypothetical protein n=1 Tax=Gaetbulibacter sp. M240 TaxID=3126511 RepID=UPI00374ECB4A